MFDIFDKNCYILNIIGDNMNQKVYLKDYSEIIKELNTNIDYGLDNFKSSKLLEKYGENLLPQKKGDSIFKIFFKGLLDPIVIILIVTTVISLLIGELIDAVVISFIIVLDLILGTIEEYHANKKADSLKNIIKYNVKVYRNGEECIIDSSLLVPGDIVLLESGDKITADMRIISCSNLQVDESILTGESAGVSKISDKLKKETILAERSNMLFAGTSVITGRSRAVVVATGINTIIGDIFDTVSKMKE